MRLALVCLALAAPLIAKPAVAQFDMTGSWEVHVVDIDVPFDFVQTGSALVATESGLTWVGSIDTGTGVFSIHADDAAVAMLLQCGVIDAALTVDGDHFSGTFATAPLQCTGLHPPVCTCGTFTTQSSVIGTRLTGGAVCGDGAVEGGEQCDDGNVLAGDCCSAACAFESAGATCADAEACTYDTCDGAGLCTSGPFPGCLIAQKSAAISLRSDAVGARVRWAWKDHHGQTSVADFGTPVVDTGYRLCLFAGSSLLFAGEVPAAGGWLEQSGGFTYKSLDSAPDGIGFLKLRATGPNSRLLAKGKGPLVTFATPLAVPSVRAQLLRDGGGPCWEATFDAPKISQPTRFVARK